MARQLRPLLQGARLGLATELASMSAESTI